MRRIGLSLCVLLAFRLANAQDSAPSAKMYLGLDLLKPIVKLFERGVVLEPMVKIPIGHRVYFNGIVGYSSFRKDSIYHNLSYRNQGIYGKAGLEFHMIPPRKITFSFGFNLSYIHLKESGRVTLKGPYFGDVSQEFTQSLGVFAIEHTLNLGWFLSPDRRFYLNAQGRLDWMTTRPTGQVFPVYHVPGMGEVIQREETSATEAGAGLTGGFSVQLFYKLF